MTTTTPRKLIVVPKKVLKSLQKEGEVKPQIEKKLEDHIGRFITKLGFSAPIPSAPIAAEKLDGAKVNVDIDSTKLRCIRAIAGLYGIDTTAYIYHILKSL